MRLMKALLLRLHICICNNGRHLKVEYVGFIDRHIVNKPKITDCVIMP
jgi:hypothetical protein